MKILSHYVLVRVDKPEQVSGGGIILPEVTVDKDAPVIGTVIAAGTGYRPNGKTIPLECNVGDQVIFPEWAGQEVKIDDDKYLFLSENFILAKIEGD